MNQELAKDFFFVVHNTYINNATPKIKSYLIFFLHNITIILGNNSSSDLESRVIAPITPVKISP